MSMSYVPRHDVPLVTPDDLRRETEMAAVIIFDRYLENLNTTLWGRAWDIHDPDIRRQAAEWAVKQFKESGLL